jgi:reverse gyrase
MDAYQKALHKLYEVTEGKSSKAVDFKSLVKQLGFPSIYPDIFERLSGQGWIIETAKADYVCISHWGVAEVKKTLAPQIVDPNAELKARAGKALAASNELSNLLEKFIQNFEKDNLTPVQTKLDELQNIIVQIKKDLT